MYVIAFVTITLALVTAFLSLNVEKNVEKEDYVKQFIDKRNIDFLNKIPDIYDRTYSLLHISNYKHYIDNDGFRYKDIILLNNKNLCNIDIKNGYRISNCIPYEEHPALNSDDLKVMYQFLPPPTNSMKDLTGIIFVENSFVPSINKTLIPRMIIEFAKVEKISGRNYEVKHTVRADTYSTVENKIRTADNIIENVSQYIRQYAKVKFKQSNYNPFVQEFGLTRLRYLDINSDTISTEKKFVRLRGSLGYGLITSKMKMLPNSYTYKMSVNKFSPLIVSGTNIWDGYFNNNYTMSDWDSYNGLRILYSLTYLNTNSMYDKKWYENYNPYSLYDDIYEILDEETYLVGLDEHAALEKITSILNHVKEVDIKVKTVRQYYNDKFHVDFHDAFYVNPFYGNNYPFDILIDNSSNLTYNPYEINNETYKIVNRYKITFALPYVIDHIDNENISDSNKYKGIYYRTYVITTIK